MKLTVMGAGAWGTALAMTFAGQHEVTLWGRDAAQLALMAQQRCNARYLDGIVFPPALRLEADLAAALRDSELVLIVTPTAGLRASLQGIVAAGCSAPVLWACKGLEASTMQLPHVVADEVLPAGQLRGVLSGPSFAQEVARNLPAALTLASSDLAFARRAAGQLHCGHLRVYSSDDVVGVEIGGALKNVMAIATGVCDGLKLGNNARAALVTRGLAEITRFGLALGAQAETFMGLSGLGDLILTCTGDLSRNRRVGLLLADGRSLADILTTLGHVAEGVPTAREVLRRSEALGLDMPITRAVCQVLYGAAPVSVVLGELMGREHKDEAT